MYTSAAKTLTQIGEEMEYIKARKGAGEITAIYCSTPTGLMRVHRVNAVQEDLIMLQGITTGCKDSFFCSPAMLQIVIRIEEIKPGEKELVVDGFGRPKSQQPTVAAPTGGRPDMLPRRTGPGPRG